MWIPLLAGVLVLAGSASATGQGAHPTPARPQTPRSHLFDTIPTFGVGKQTNPQTKDPYARLFSPGRSAARQAMTAQPKPRTVCGLTVWNVEPDLDSRSLIRPREPRVDYKIGKLAPPVCVE